MSENWDWETCWGLKEPLKINRSILTAQTGSSKTGWSGLCPVVFSISLRIKTPYPLCDIWLVFNHPSTIFFIYSSRISYILICGCCLFSFKWSMLIRVSLLSLHSLHQVFKFFNKFPPESSFLQAEESYLSQPLPLSLNLQKPDLDRVIQTGTGTHPSVWFIFHFSQPASSANLLRVHSVPPSRPLMKMLNSVGLDIDPRGTTLGTGSCWTSCHRAGAHVLLLNLT